MSRSLRLGAVVLSGLLMLLGGITLALDGLTTDDLGLVPGVITVWAVAAGLVTRVPNNAVSWAMFGGAMGLILMSFYELDTLFTGIGLFALALPSLGVFVPLWFPTGHLVSKRWRWVPLTAVAGVVGVFAGSTVETLSGGVHVAETIEGCTSVGSCLEIGGLMAMLIALIAALASFVTRWIRSRGIERQQMKWLLPPFVLFAVGALAEFGGFQGSMVADIVLPLGLFLIPIAIGLAVLRYRLYEVDRLVSRTLSYSVVVGFLVLVFFGIVTALTAVLPGESDLAVAGSTLAVAALFNPVRRRVQVSVDRRFNRSRYDAERVMDHFAGSLRDQVDAGDVIDGWVGVVSETMHPASVSVWVRERP